MLEEKDLKVDCVGPGYRPGNGKGGNRESAPLTRGSHQTHNLLKENHDFNQNNSLI